MSKHSIYAPSSAHRWFNCPGSIDLIQRAKKSKLTGTGVNQAALDGTAAHAEAERILQRGCYGLDHADRAVRFYIRHIYQQKEKTPIRAEFIEFPLRSHRWPDLFGTLDYAMWSNERLVVMDYKNGGWKLYHPDGVQLKVYAFMLLEWIICDEVLPPPSLELHIVQPNYEGEEPVRIKVFDTEQFYNDFGDQLDGAMFSIQENPEYTRMGPWCQYCKATSICPSQAQHLRELFDTSEEVDNVEDLDMASFLDVLEKAQSVNRLIQETRDRAKELLAEGKELDGWELQVYSNGSKRLRPTTKSAEYAALFDEED